MLRLGRAPPPAHAGHRPGQLPGAAGAGAPGAGPLLHRARGPRGLHAPGGRAGAWRVGRRHVLRLGVQVQAACPEQEGQTARARAGPQPSRPPAARPPSPPCTSPQPPGVDRDPQLQKVPDPDGHEAGGVTLGVVGRAAAAGRRPRPGGGSGAGSAAAARPACLAHSPYPPACLPAQPDPPSPPRRPPSCPCSPRRARRSSSSRPPRAWATCAATRWWRRCRCRPRVRRLCGAAVCL